MAKDSTGGIDPRFPEVFQRGGAAPAPVLDDGIAVRASRRPPASLPGVSGAGRPQPVTGQVVAPVSDPREALHGYSLDEPTDEKHFELIVAGNPWLRALWVVGGLATIAGFALTVYAEFAFSVPPASGIYDPSVYIVPRIAEAVAQPLVIAGVVALVAAAALRIAAWRPSRVTAVITERS